MDKTIVLSEEKQTILATLYLVGVRDIVIQDNNFAFWMVEGFFGPSKGFGGNFPFISEEFSFKELKELMNSWKVSLYDVIKTYCPKYQYVLNYKPFKDED